MANDKSKRSNELIPAMVTFGCFAAVPGALIGMVASSWISGRLGIPLSVWQGALLGACLGASIGALRAYLEYQRLVALDANSAYLGFEPLAGPFRGAIMGRLGRLFSKEATFVTAYGVDNDTAKVAIGDVRLTVHVVRDGKKQTGSQSKHSYVYFEFADTLFPKFNLHPESQLDRLIDTVQDQDIDFEDSPEFSSLYQLKSDDPAQCRMLFNASVRNAISRSKPWKIGCEQSWLIFLRKSRFKTGDDQKQFLSQCMEIASLIHQQTCKG